MLDNKFFKIKKNERKIKSCDRCRTPKISKELSLNNKSLSIKELICYSPSCKNKTKLMITNLLSSSKRIIINKNIYSSSNIFQKNIKFNYPYNPKNFHNKSNFSIKETKNNLILHPKTKNLTRNINENLSPKIIFSTFRSNNSKYKKIQYNNNIFFKPKKNQFYINRKNFRVKSAKSYFKKTFEDNYNYNSYDNEYNKENIHLNEEAFLHYIDEMNNNNNNYICEIKSQMKEYFFNDDKKDGNKLYFEKLLYNYKFDEQECDNYFLTDFHSVKKNSFRIGNLNLSLKITSLQFIYYEITDGNIIEKNIDSKKFYDIQNNSNIKYLINSKIKFPFEFLSIFYGINFNEFINLIISMIEFDYKTDKFYIDNNNFIEKIEISKKIYDFYNDESYISLYNSNNSRECFLFDWDVKSVNINKVKHFVIKILLPQMKISIESNDKRKVKFVSNIDIKTMGNLMKNSFNKWDFYILVYFSELKLFRFEINKILCEKYTNINKRIYDENKNKKEKKIKNISFNLNKIHVIINTMKNKARSYGLFYSHKNIKNKNNEAYYIKLKIPKINISFHNSIYSYNKKFDIDIKRMSQINKLRKSFNPEDIIKYSMIIIKGKYNDEDMIKQRAMNKRIFHSKKTTKYTRRNSYFINKNKSLSQKNVLSYRYSTKRNGIKGQINFTKNYDNEEYIKDIKLNLDKFIFNFDESVLKLIKVNENTKINNFIDILKKDENTKNDVDNLIKKNMNFNFKNINNIKELNQNNDDNKIEIEIGTIEVSWINQDGLSNKLFLNKNETEYLLDIPTFQWKFFIEKNIEKIIKYESNIFKSNRKESNNYYKEIKKI